MIRSLLPAFLTVALGTAGASASAAEDPSAGLPGRAEVQSLIDQGTAWVRAHQQGNGCFAEGPIFHLGITSLTTLALLEAGVPKDDPAITKALEYILSFKQGSGAIFDPSQGNANYNTSLALMVLATVTYPDQAVIKAAQQSLIGSQNVDPDSINHGGIGYGSRGEGNEDLSNTTFAVEALRASGIPADDPAMQRALKFVERCQNHSSVNDTPAGQRSSQDGGGAYSPDSSKAGSYYEDGHQGEKPADPSKPGKATKLVSYGTMTYALIKNYLALELKPEDQRVQLALDWIKKNYRLDGNPGLPAGRDQEGLFYQYLLMTSTFSTLGVTELDLGAKGKHDWRADVFQVIKAAAQPVAGKADQVFWINAASRWGEGFPALTTAYTLRALGQLKKSLPEDN